MCGIAGIWVKTGAPPSRELLERLSGDLRHRGPDAEGLRIAGPVGLINRRLKVLDLSDKANQPWTDGADILVFNGEIFNHAALRRELSAHFEFQTRSDTEVLFRALQHWGPNGIRRLHGQFSLGFLDARRGELVLSRDHAGICPLYTFETADALYFASEIRPLLRVAPCRMDPQGAIDYLAFRYNPGHGRTLFSGIRRFPAAHTRRIDLRTGSATTERHWRLSFSGAPIAEGESREAFRAIFNREVALQSIADVPVGLFLSGGLDSRAVLDGLSHATSKIIAFTMTFGSGDPELAQVDALERRYGFHAETVRHDWLGLDIERIVRIVEEPFGDLIMGANEHLARAASSRVKVVLSGEGGDEAFCGYDHQRAFERLARFSGGLRGLAMQLALGLVPASWVGRINSYPGRFGEAELARVRHVHGALDNPAEAYVELVRLFSQAELDTLLAPAFKIAYGSSPDDAALQAATRGDAHLWQGVMRAEIEQLTLPLNLLKQDRFCMAVSLEGRVPLAARSVMEFAGSLPASIQQGPISKPLLRDAGGVPNAAKRPFSVLEAPETRQAIQRLLDTYAHRESVEDMGVLAWPAVVRLRDSIAEGGILALKQAMAVAVLMAWWRVFKPQGVSRPVAI